ncbi:MAG: hypothetical protein N3D14_04445 [Aquificaceae bacterium]|nr:hypothetical protein [Aquificaceae bacterium]MCX8164624.1 hypothetical protein [Aquificaceae bacterium]
MAELIDVYKNMENNLLFHTRLEKLGYEEGKVSLSITPLARRFILIGDMVRIGYMNILLPGRVVGKNESIIVSVLYAGEGRFGDRNKPRAPVHKNFGFTVLIKFDGVFRTFEPIDISEEGISVMALDGSYLPSMLGKNLEFKITGRDELAGVSGTARLVGIMEDRSKIKLALEIQTDDASTTKIRLYVVNTIKRLLTY